MRPQRNSDELENPMDFDLHNALNDDWIAQLGGADNPHTNSVFEKNMAALGIKNPRAAQSIINAMPNGGLRFMQTDEGVESVELDGIALASKRKPMQEAKRFAERFDPSEVACCAVVGFGMGYHCGTLLERLGTCGIIICFEPDVGLLRAVFERVDYSKMIETERFYLVTDVDDPAALTQIFEGIEAVIGLGVEILSHPPSVQRIGDASGRFGRVFGDVLKATRTHVITTLANSQVSFRNAMMNLDYYATSAGVESLKDVCKGKPAVVVSAGPSLGRNLDVLCDPNVRKSVVVIAAQTVLKQMLALGIKPDFVAALDYHEISKRFYEGISAEDVEGVRLIVEAKANPAILNAFPGEVLCVWDDLLDNLLGEELTREMGRLTMGGTVAHLCYYFARYLGCDPVIFIGQDLGFTDGQYYSAGAAIHQVWSGELNAHNTLEMMEWQRIVRMKGLLQKRTDIHGRSIYLDEQMGAYLSQFESQFQQDSASGLIVIDASEGGVRKLHTTVMTLVQAIEIYGQGGEVRVPATVHLRNEDAERTKQIHNRLDSVIEDSERIVYLSEETIGVLKAMLKVQSDQPKVNKLIHKVEAIRDRVVVMDAAFRLTQAVNQIGVLNRMKHDRSIEMKPGETALDRQRLQIERDITNVEWTRDAAKAVAEQLIAGRDVFLGLATKETNDLRDAQQRSEAQDGQVSRKAVVHAVVMADPEFGGLGTKRDLGAIISQGMNALELTIARLGRASQLDGITIVTPDPDAIRCLIGATHTSMPNMLNMPIIIAGVDRQRFRDRAARNGSARVQSSECWRGSIGMLSVYDEQLHPALLGEVMHEHAIDACAIVGADWAMIDPDLVNETVQRYRCQDEEKRMAFSQAVPGIGTMVVDRATVDSLAKSMTGSLNTERSGRNHFATLGALVGDIPTVPQFDPIAKGMCVEVDPAVRDAGVRVMADTSNRSAMMREAYQSIGGSAVEADALQCVAGFGGATKRLGRVCPRTIVLETCTGRLVGGQWGTWNRNSIEPIERQVLSLERAHALLQSAGALREDVAVVFDGVGDPLMHPQALAFAQLAKEDGIACVELRTDFGRDGIDGAELLESGIDVLSVDVLAENNQAYAAITGQDRFGDVYAQIQSVFDAMHADQGHSLWFVPRLTRCDAAYEDIEQFFDKWLMICGSAVIDPMPSAIKTQRIQQLPIPSDRQRQLDRSTMYIQCDGVVIDRHGEAIGSHGRVINAFDLGIEQAYQQACSAMRSSQIEPKAGVSTTEEHAA